jgi:hypothetical protein
MDGSEHELLCLYLLLITDATEQSLFASQEIFVDLNCKHAALGGNSL